MVKSWSRALLSLVVVAGLVPAMGVADAQTPDPLLADSLKALTSLITAEHCKLQDAADANAADNLQLPYVYCNDGLPPEGGGSLAIPVPVKYAANQAGDDWSGLPPPASTEEVGRASADDLRPESNNRISLDVDITLPPSRSMATLVGSDLKTLPAPKRGYPVIVFMHGCCGGNKTGWEATTIDAANEHWHHSNAWFASRGYVVVTYTARGFRDANEQGSTGTTQLDSRRYEINDYQYLVGLLADHDMQMRDMGLRPFFNINPRKIGAVGGSYGGGFSWLAATDPTWRSPVARKSMKLAAAVPKYGWTDLVESLVPSGHYFDRDPVTNKTSIAPSSPTQALSRKPLGVEKQSIVSGLFATGNLRSGNHTTFPEYIEEAYLRLQQGEPYDGDPTLESLADSFLKDRSAYFQERFWDRVRNGLKVPLFIAATWTDPLFPAIESVRFYNKLRRLKPRYPMKMYLGDYQHFVANKPKEWDDLCGNDHHVCTIDDYRRGGALNFNRASGRVRVGINTRINRFLDYYLKGRGTKPGNDVSATTTTCAANASDRYKVDEPGIEYRAKRWRALAPKIKTFEWEGGGPLFGSTTSTATDGHAQESDPVFRQTQSDKCFTTSQPDPGPGVVRFVHKPLEKPITMMGIPTWKMKYSAMGVGTLQNGPPQQASDYWVSARILDLAPDGAQTLVTRGVCRVNTSANPKQDCSVFDLWGNGWRFEKGNTVVVEISQADTPLFRRDNFPSTLSIETGTLHMPLTSEKLNVDFRN
jgi:predicted acyl esterase